MTDDGGADIVVTPPCKEGIETVSPWGAVTTGWVLMWLDGGGWEEGASAEGVVGEWVIIVIWGSCIDIDGSFIEQEPLSLFGEASSGSLFMGLNAPVLCLWIWGRKRSISEKA